jgi:hypothetical protein
MAALDAPTHEIVVVGDAGEELRGHVPNIGTMTPEQRRAEIEQLTAEDAKFGLKPIWRRHLGDLHRSLQEDAHADALAARQASDRLTEVSPRREATQAQVLASALAYVEAREAASDVYAEYEDAYRNARKLGQPAEKIAHGSFPSDLLHRLQIATQGARSAW